MSPSRPDDADDSQISRRTPASATGMFSTAAASQPASEPAGDDFFAQFNHSLPPAQGHATRAASPTETCAPAQDSLSPSPYLSVAQSAETTHTPPAPLSTATKLSARPSAPPVREIFIKPSRRKQAAATSNAIATERVAPTEPLSALEEVREPRLTEESGSDFTRLFAARHEESNPLVQVSHFEPIRAVGLQEKQFEPAPSAGSTHAPGDFTQMFHSSPPASVEALPTALVTPSPPPALPPAHAANATAINPVEASHKQSLRAITETKISHGMQDPSAAASEPVKVFSIDEILQRLDQPVTAKTLSQSAGPAAGPLEPPQREPFSAPAEKPPFSEIARKQNAHGSFMQPIRDTVSDAVLVVPEVPRSFMPAATPAVLEAESQAPGSFTQFMSGIVAQPASASPPLPSIAHSAAPFAQAPTSQDRSIFPQYGGSFTQRTPSPDRPAAQSTYSPQPTPPGSITQLLQSLDKTAEPASQFAEPPLPRADSEKGVPGQSVSHTPSDGFTQFFSNPVGLQGSEIRENPFDSSPSDWPRAPAQQGGFTQLLQALNQPPSNSPPADPSLRGLMAQQAPKGMSPFAPTPPAASDTALGAPGSFTQLLQTFNRPSPASQSAAPSPGASVPASLAGSATSIFAAPAPSVAPRPAPSGPSEFTQILSGSALRDARAQAPGNPPARAPEPVLPGPLQMPSPPQMPAFAMPVMPQIQMPGVAVPQIQAPQTPAPSPSAAAPQKTKLQQYLPLILIANVLVLIVIVVIVIFVLRSHR